MSKKTSPPHNLETFLFTNEEVYAQGGRSLAGRFDTLPLPTPPEQRTKLKRVAVVPPEKQPNTVNVGGIVQNLRADINTKTREVAKAAGDQNVNLQDFQRTYDAIDDLEAKFGALGQIKFKGGLKLDKGTAKASKADAVGAPPPKPVLPKTEPMDMASAPPEVQAAIAQHRKTTQPGQAHSPAPAFAKTVPQQAVSFAQAKSTPTAMLDMDHRGYGGNTNAKPAPKASDGGGGGGRLRNYLRGLFKEQIVGALDGFKPHQ